MKLCSIASGSSGNCIFVGTESTAVLIDAGISGKKVIEGLLSIGRKPEDLNAILITHEHSDHVKGLGVLVRKFGIPVYTSPGTFQAQRHPRISRTENRYTALRSAVSQFPSSPS